MSLYGICIGGIQPAAAQADAATFAEQEKLVRASRQVSAYGPQLFGDSINLYTGKLQFTHTDISVPGNSALPVEVRRVFTAGNGGMSNAMFGDWDLDLPSIRGTFAVGSNNFGWAVDGAEGTADGYKRCTYFGEPPEARPIVGLSRWMPWEYWFGTTLNAPNGGEILTRASGNTAAPATGHSWPLVTKSGWQLRCLASLHSQNLDSSFNKGEGFIAIDPAGNQYRFDWMVQRSMVNLKKWRNGSLDQLPRSEFLIFPSEVTDRHGNWVRYNFNPASRSQLLSITASDGRSISFGYDTGNRIASASTSDGTRTLTWTYGGSTGGFTVTQPDGSRWQMDLGALKQTAFVDGDPACGLSTVYEQPTTGTMTHPSGAAATFSMKTVRHGRKVSTTCSSQRWTWFPKNFGVRALTSKTLSGPGMASSTWQYQYDTSLGSEPSCTTCPNTKTVRVTDPRGYVTRHTFGIVSLVNDGQLLQLDEGWNGTSAVRTTTYRFRDKAAGPYPSPAGYSPNPRSDALQSLYHTPLDQGIVTQQGVNFTWQANSFDTFALPLAVTRLSGLGSKSETTAWENNLGKWVLGQVKSVTDGSGLVQELHEYDATTASRTASHRFGLLQERYTYDAADGTLYQRLDPLNRATKHTNYMRGIAQTITHPDGAVDSAVVNNIGLVTSLTNAETNLATSYGYDLMGRLSSIVYPNEPNLSYHPTTQAFEPVPAAEYGLAPGHWRQTVSTGNARTVRYFDALWRERLSHSYDLANPAGTGSAVETRYDADGRKVFASYAQRNPSPIDTALPGSAWAHDALGRVFAQYQDSELGVLSTSTTYLAGFQRRVTNPRGHVTTTSFHAWDQPSEEAIAGIAAPEGVSVSILRDVFGKPSSITRSGAGLSATRSYVFDAHQRLCKTVEPESGATVQGYDAANNLAWRASGLSAGTACGAIVAPASTITYGYDARNRLKDTSYGDASPAIGRSYMADGLPSQVWSAGSTWTYAYNNRRLLVSESLAYGVGSYSFGRGIDAYGNLASLAYPGGPTVTYDPDALGRPRQVSGYASNASYHPNGAIAGYTLLNGIVHTSTQNTRGLPLLWRDAGVVQDAYAFDANANVASIADQQEGLSSRSLGYDGLDRLTSASGVWGAGSFGYDALDNLRTSAVGARSLSHNIDAATNRLSSLSGSLSIGFGYDANGNISTRGSQTYSFDIGNRLNSAPGKASYAYDGHGRRTWVGYADGSSKVQVYGLGGKLLYTRHSTQGDTRHIFLGDRLIAEANSLSGSSYSHTDALGSPVAKTNGAGALLSRTRYEPYGATAAGTNPTGIGFTGHVNDADTGLVQMQQRYYEPLAGRFLGVDPVTTDANTGSSFNRYVYGNNNPYRYTDPDGRAPRVDDGLGDARIGGSRAPDLMARDSGGRFVQYTPEQAIANLQATRAANGLTVESTLSSNAAKGAKGLPDSALVCRGGTCTADKFATGSGVTVDSTGRLQGVSVNSGAGKTVEQLTVGIPNKQVGVTTVGDVRRAGGDVIPSGTTGNPNHCTLCGITPQQAERLMTPTIKNPHQ